MKYNLTDPEPRRHTRPRWYVGCIQDFCLGTYRYEAFKSIAIPTEDSHGHRYTYTIGPFVTKRAALWAEKYGAHNPHFGCVQDAEELARLEVAR